MQTMFVRIALSTVLAASLAATARADGTTNTPGAACVAATGSLQVRSDGEIQNSGTSTAIAVCPAERPIAPSATTKLSGRVFVVDRSTTADVCCKVISKNANGALEQSASVCSSSASTSYQSLVLPEISDVYTYSHFFVQCTVPPVSAGAASRIQMYRTTQQ